jgi:hypothetical protein
MICPIKTDPAWIKLKNAQPDLAHYLWNEYEGEVPAEFYTSSAPKTLSFNLFSSEEYSKNPSLYIDEVQRVVRLIENKLRIKQKPFTGKTTDKFIDKQDYVNDILKQLLENIGLPNTISTLEELKGGLNNGSVLDYINKEYTYYKTEAIDTKNDLDEVNSKIRVLNNFLNSQDVEGYSEEQQGLIKISFPALFGNLGRYKSKAQALAHYKQTINTPKFLNKVVNLDSIKMSYFRSQSKMVKFENLLNYNELSPEDFKDRIFKVIENELNRRSEFFDSPKMQKVVLDEKEKIAKRNYERSVKGILERFGKNENSISGKVAKVFLQHPNTLNAIKSENINRSFFGFAGGEWKGDGTLDINYTDEKSLRHILLHELTHHFTVPYVFTYLKNHSNANKYVGFSERFPTQEDLNEDIEYSVKQLTEKEIESISKIEDIYIHVLNLHKQGKIQFTEKQFSTNPEYGLENLYEFLSEVISNPYFAAEIAKQPALFNKKSNLLQDIIDAIFKMFGINNTSLLDDVYSLFEESFLFKDSNYNFKSLTDSSSSFKYDTSLNERQYQLPNQVKPGVGELFNENPELADQVYEALGFNQTITQNNESYFRGQIEKPTIDKDGNLVLYGREDQLYKRAGLKSKGVSMTDDLQSAIDYGNGQLEVAQNLASENYDVNNELEELLENGYYLIQIPKSISNEIITEAGEVKIIGDKIIVPKGQYKIEQIIDDAEKITPQQKQQALQQYSAYLDSIFPKSKVKDIVYHGSTNNNKQKFKKSTRVTGHYFATTPKEALQHAQRQLLNKEDATLYKIILDLKNPRIIKDIIDYEELDTQAAFTKGDTLFGYDADGIIAEQVEEYNTTYKLPESTWVEKQIIVFEPEQIHILGNKQDIEGFKKFVQDDKLNLDTTIEDCGLPS